MAERVFSIDFGSAYTKIANSSRDPTADSTLLACEGAEFDFWVPTVVAVDVAGKEPRLEFGDRAMDIKPGGGIDVYANFKQDLFANPAPTPDKPLLSPVDAACFSPTSSGLWQLSTAFSRTKSRLCGR